jgi:hypothetical protein
MRLPPERGLLALMLVAAALCTLLTLALLAAIVALCFVEDLWPLAVLLLGLRSSASPSWPITRRPRSTSCGRERR